MSIEVERLHNGWQMLFYISYIVSAYEQFSWSRGGSTFTTFTISNCNQCPWCLTLIKSIGSVRKHVFNAFKAGKCSEPLLRIGKPIHGSKVDCPDELCVLIVKLDSTHCANSIVMFKSMVTLKLACSAVYNMFKFSKAAPAPGAQELRSRGSSAVQQ